MGSRWGFRDGIGLMCPGLNKWMEGGIMEGCKSVRVYTAEDHVLTIMENNHLPLLRLLSFLHKSSHIRRGDLTSTNLVL